MFFSKKKSKIATRHQFLLDLVLLVVLLGVALGTLSLVLDVQSQDDLARDLTHQAVQEARQQFTSQIEPIESMLKVIGKWGEDGQLDLNKTSTLNAKFIPMLEEKSGVTSLAIANNKRREYLLLPERKGWLTRTRNNTLKNNEFLWQRWVSANKSIQSWNEKSDNDKEQEKWYQHFTSGKNTSKLVWSVINNFSNQAEPAIIATKNFRAPNQAESVSVARIDIRLSEIIKDIETEYSSDRGEIFLISPGKQVLTATRSEKQSHIQFLAATEWSERGEQENEAFTLKALGKTWWSCFLPLQKDDASGWIAVTIPEAKLLADSEQTSWIIAVWVSVVLLIGIILSLILVHRYKKYFRENSTRILASKDIESQIEKLLTQGENPNLEFKSTVRTNLKTGKSDKDIEFSWLKTVAAFLNTQGGILLIGVDDSGQVLGLEADNFETDDKCRLHLKNLIHQHIGPTFSRFIDFEIFLFHDESIIVLECEPSPGPVFLRKGQSEDFFIRSGPASVPLTISQTIEYLQHDLNSRNG